MKFLVSHVFSGSIESLARNTGGVETFLNNMLKNNVGSTDVYSAVIGRQCQFIPQVVTEFKLEEVDQIRRNRIRVPYLTYLFSNLILGVCLSFYLSMHNREEGKTSRQPVIHAHDPIIAASLFLFFPKFLKSETLVVQFHSEYRKRLEIMLPHTLLSRLTVRVHSYLEKMSTWRADVVLAASAHIRDYLIAIGCSNKKIQIVPLFIEPRYSLKYSPTAQSVESLGIRKNQFILAYTGRLSKEKNLDVLLSAFLSLGSSTRKHLTLLIVGTGDQLNNLKRLATPEISGKVLFLGQRSDIDFILNISDVFILPSLSEGFSFSILEAMRHGKAIIASNVSPLNEILTDGHDALLVDPRNPEQMRNAITLLYSNPELRRTLGLNAKEKERQYDKARIFPMLIDAYTVKRKNRN